MLACNLVLQKFLESFRTRGIILGFANGEFLTKTRVLYVVVLFSFYFKFNYVCILSHPYLLLPEAWLKNDGMD